MRKNGPIALIFHTLVIAFVLAPLVIVVLVAFTPDETLTLPTHGFSLRWFRAILDYPDFISGNIKYYNIIDIFNGEKYNQFRSTLREVGMFPICSRCCGLMGF